MILHILVKFVFKFMDGLNIYSHIYANKHRHKQIRCYSVCLCSCLSQQMIISANSMHPYFAPSYILVLTWVSGPTEATQSKFPHFLSVLWPKRFSMFPVAIKRRVARRGQRWMSKKWPKREGSETNAEHEEGCECLCWVELWDLLCTKVKQRTKCS